MRLLGVLLLLSHISIHASTIDAQSSCFKKFPTYQSWVDFVQSKNKDKPIPEKVLHKIVPPDDYKLAVEKMDCQFIYYKSDGYDVSGYSILPKKKTLMGDKKYPVVIYNRGGNQSFGATTVAGTFKYMIPLAKEGFIVLASQYRGLQSNDPERFGQDQFGGDDVNDVLALLKIAENMPMADTDNIFMMGGSRGAMMNYLVAKQTDRIRAIVSTSGPTDLLTALDWRPEMENVYKMLIPDYQNDKENQLKQRSVIYWAEELPEKLPILIFHGAKDKRVHVDDAKNFAKKLEALDRPHKLVIYPEENHFLRSVNDDVLKQTVEWFRSHAKQS